MTSGVDITFYEQLIVPLLHRMSNLEELILNLSIRRRRRTHYNSFIDGNNLKNDIISHMPKLNKFVFSIHSNLYLHDLRGPPPFPAFLRNGQAKTLETFRVDRP